jgi:osmotically-inducible protein OsmY
VRTLKKFVFYYLKGCFMESTERRPDVDIEEEIGQLVRSFAPLKASYGYFAYKSSGGVVKVTGNVRTPQARRVLLDNIPRITGVVSCDNSELYDDDQIRFAVGQLLPPGIFASVHYGAVALTGRLPDGASADTIAEAIRRVSGVRRVGAEFGAVVTEPPSPEKIEPPQA